MNAEALWWKGARWQKEWQSTAAEVQRWDMSSDVTGSQLSDARSSGVNSQRKELLLGHNKQDSGRFMFFLCEGSDGGQLGTVVGCGGLWRGIKRRQADAECIWR